MVGRDIDHLVKRCESSYSASRSAKPEDFNDQGWLEAFYTLDGKHVFALTSMDYHPWRHGIRCGSKASDAQLCWFGSIISAYSNDQGFHFASTSDPAQRYVAGPASTFNQADPATKGALAVSNIIRFRGAYYALISVARDGPQAGGECLIRNPDITDLEGWRAWDGQKFSIGFADPYRAEAEGHRYRACTTLSSIAFVPVRSLVRYRDEFMLISYNPNSTRSGSDSAVVAQTSSDLTNWTAPVVVMKLPMYRPNYGKRGEVAYYYPSIIASAMDGFNSDVVWDNVYIYLTKYRYGQGNNRDLVRFPLRIGEIH